MQQNDLNTGAPNTAFFIGGTILNLFFIWDIYLFFEKTAIVPRMLAAGSFILLLILLIPFWIRVFKILKS